MCTLYAEAKKVLSSSRQHIFKQFDGQAIYHTVATII